MSIISRFCGSAYAKTHDTIQNAPLNAIHIAGEIKNIIKRVTIGAVVGAALTNAAVIKFSAIPPSGTLLLIAMGVGGATGAVVAAIDYFH